MSIVLTLTPTQAIGLNIAAPAPAISLQLFPFFKGDTAELEINFVTLATNVLRTQTVIATNHAFE